MGTLGWGILGTGGIAKRFAADLNSVGRNLVAVGSRSADTAASFATANAVGRAYGSYDDLVADPDVDVIYVATPHPWHAAHAELALRNGKHVLVEKPFALNTEQARHVQGVATERGLFAMEAMRTRFLPHTVRIHELIRDGALGRIHTFTADHTRELDSNPRGRLWNPDLGGGALLDLGIYPLSFASDLLGSPSHVEATATMTSTGVDLDTSVTLDYANGARAHLHTAMNTNGSNRASILGDRARIEIAPLFYTSSKFQLIDGNDRVLEDFDEPYSFGGKQFEALEVEHCVRSGLTESPRMTVTETVSIHRTMDAVRERIGLRYPMERDETDR